MASKSTPKQKIGRPRKSYVAKKVEPPTHNAAHEESCVPHGPLVPQEHSIGPETGNQRLLAQKQSLGYEVASPIAATLCGGGAGSSPISAERDSQQETNHAASAPANNEFDIQPVVGMNLGVFINGTWRPAVWHHELVIRLNAAEFGTHLFDIEPPRKHGIQSPADKTAFLLHQKAWGFYSRDQHPEIVFQLYPEAGQFLNKGNSVPWLEIEICRVNRIVVDIITRRPLRDFKNIPVQLATNVESGRLEAMAREDCRIVSEDFLQRMIPFLDTSGNPLQNQLGQILSARPVKKSLENSKIQFRNQYRCLSWNTRKHDSEFDVRLLRELTEDDKATNTTRNLPELCPAEITAIRSVAKGRKSRALAANTELAVYAATMHEPSNSITEGAEDESMSQISGVDGTSTTATVTENDPQPGSQDCLTPTSQLVVDTGMAAKHRCHGRKSVTLSPKKGTDSPPSGLEDSQPQGSQVVDPGLLVATAEAAHALVSESLTLKSTTHSLESDQIFPLPAEDVTATTEPVHAAINADRSQRKRSHSQDLKNLDAGVVGEVPPSGGGGEPSAHPNKRLRTLSPRANLDPVPDYSAVGSSISQPLIFGTVPQHGAFSAAPPSSFQARPINSSTIGRPETSQLVANKTWIYHPWPNPNGPPGLVQPTQVEQVQCSEDGQARFNFVSAKVLELKKLKGRLIRDWWAKQSSGTLYGHILTVPLSYLGHGSSYRADEEMRSFMLAYAIPSNWSASSINLCDHARLNLAVHNALCEAESWDERNYRSDYPGILDLATEGGFFMALAQASSIAREDSRFTFFSSNVELNASLQSAFWRYKQLTGRTYAPPGHQAFASRTSTGSVHYNDAWCAIRRQLFLPYFLRFRDAIEALAWMPDLGMLDMWCGGADKWRTSASHVRDEFGCRDDVDLKGALDPRCFGRKWGWRSKKVGVLPLLCVDLNSSEGVSDA